ncbi:hypothetical protein CDAR_165101 [Caerostris darwini]|uniref:Uncharacterized protein n=1 Tax=Caerostris darwini TaxID=1538125 RepID=A0AAV4NV36_9ARAC|nr:hypothetical protein CDAR_165101 [Caerostris darwini]
METLPCPEFFSGNKFFKALWNFPKYLFPSLLCSAIVTQSLWLSFLSDAEDEWTALIILFLQLWIYINLFRSRTRIRPLTKNLERISNMVRVDTIQRKGSLKIYIWVYCLLVMCWTACFEVALFNSRMVAYDQQRLRKSEFIPVYLKEHLVAILNGAYAFIILIGNGFFSVSWILLLCMLLHEDIFFTLRMEIENFDCTSRVSKNFGNL